ncbi:MULTISPECIES: DUF1996 domain-containing protein [Actinomadura]|uniref:DUF1996 domain-containing protein n=1 Tax=Actinomadura madurae TaxID=1993 RepID=A0A1I4X1U7_9ACTN|nr:DUF1996 domain-containing protein [Actinomadura madurae]SFN19340.1 protein of unknown function [Actinomadura madurae]SPT62855.1 Domain of uncharacterised function (DUF1996) [Actinomadura madurae]
MIRKKKAFAAMIPALALVATACQENPGAAAQQPYAPATTQAAGAAYPAEPAGGKNAGAPNLPGADPQDPQGGGQTSAPPAGGGGQGGDGGQTGEPPAGGGQDGGQNGGGEQESPPPAGGDQGDGQDGGQGDGQNGGQDGGQGDGQNGGQGDGQDGGQGDGQDGGNEAPPIPELRADQYVSIRQAPRVRQPRQSRQASTGVFASNCGVNEGQAHSNPDNVLAAPGVVNGAHHIHDYVGNLDTNAFSTDETFAAAGTTCTNGDKSAYFWPVIRLRDGQDDSDRAEQSTADGNIGSIVTPSSVKLQYFGNARSKVVAMPRFIRVATGDAKAVTNGLANAHASWTCTGFENRAFTDKYPLCPEGSQVLRVLNFPSCWDGQNTDSANHRDHIKFTDPRTGACPQGTKAVPQLRMTLAYDVPAEPLKFALDSFPESGHDPVTDHGDLINVMDEALMQKAVNAINRGAGTRSGTKIKRPRYRR